MIRATTSCKNTTSPPQASVKPSRSNTDTSASHNSAARDEVIGSGPPAPGGVNPKSSSPCPATIRCRAAAVSSSTWPAVCAEPRCSIFRDPRREDHTICTAVAPEVVFTVRTYATTAPYGAKLVRTFPPRNHQTRRSTTYKINNSSLVAQVRFQGSSLGRPPCDCGSRRDRSSTRTAAAHRTCRPVHQRAGSACHQFRRGQLRELLIQVCEGLVQNLDEIRSPGWIQYPFLCRPNHRAEGVAETYAVDCQGPRILDHWRPADLTGGGHGF